MLAIYLEGCKKLSEFSAFLAIASGLNQHEGDSKKPIPFTHVDIGGSGAEDGDWQHGFPTGKPVVAFLTALLQ